MSLQKLLDAIEDYGFESVAGPLVNCAEYVELRRRIDIEALKPKPDTDSTVPSFDHDVYLVLDEFPRFKVYRETSEAEADKETIIRMICEGQYNKPIRVVCFNTVEGWARDVTEDIAREIDSRAKPVEPLEGSAAEFVERVLVGA